MATWQDQVNARVAEMRLKGYKGAPAISGARAMAQGATFNFADEAEAALTAGIKAMANDSEYADEYAKALEAVRYDLSKFRQAYPYLAFAAEMAGAVAVPGTLGKVAMSATRTVPGAALATGAVGGVGGALAGFGAGEGGPGEPTDVTGRLDSTLLGAGIGLATGAAVGGGARAVENLATRVAKTPDKLATQIMAKALERDAVPVPAIERAAEKAAASEAPLTLADTMSRTAGAGTNLGALLDFAAEQPGAAASKIRAEASKRLSGQASRLTDTGRNIFGDMADYMDDLSDSVAGYLRNASAAYQQVYDAVPSVTNPQVMSILQRPGVARDIHTYLKSIGERSDPIEGLGSFYNDKGQIVSVPTLKQLHTVIKHFGSPPKFGEEARAAGNPMQRVAQDLNAILKDSIPEFNAVQGQWKTGKELLEAAEMGQSYGKKQDMTKLKTFAEMTPEQQDAFRSGAFNSIVARINEAKDGRDVLNAILGSPAARRNFLAIIPKDKRASVIRRLADEYRLAQTAKQVSQNSKTQGRQAVKEDLGMTERAVDASPLMTDITTNAMLAFAAVLDNVSTSTRERALGKVADFLFSKDPEVQKQGVEKIVKEMVRTQFIKDLVPGVFDRVPAGAATGAVGTIEGQRSER